jgi:hypothetical protein
MNDFNEQYEDDGYFTSFMQHVEELLAWNNQDEDEELDFI